MRRVIWILPVVCCSLCSARVFAQQTPSDTYCDSAIPIYVYNGDIYSCKNGSPQKAAAGSISGTTNNLPKFTGPNVVGNSSLSDNGTTVATPEQVVVGNGTFSTAFGPVATQTQNNTWDTSSASAFSNAIGAQTSVDGVAVPNINLSDSTPAAPANKTNVAWQCTGSTCSANVSTPIAGIVQNPVNDVLCAHAADVTIGSLNISNIVSAGGSSWTFTMASSVTVAQYVVGQTFIAANVTPSTLNGSYTITAVSTSTITATANASQSGSYVSGGNIYMPCTNQSNDAITTSAQAFATTLTVPAISVYPTLYSIQGMFEYWTTSTAPTIALPSLFWSGSTIGTFNGTGTLRASAAGVGCYSSYLVNALLSGILETAPSSETCGSASPTGSVPVILSTVTNTSSTISMKSGFTATGIASGTYTSGGSITGSTSQTCTLSAFNNGNSGGTATVALTGTNTIAGGTALVITNTGFASTSAATSATLGNGTATCSGTATISTVLGGAQGNAIRVLVFRAVQQQ